MDDLVHEVLTALRVLLSTLPEAAPFLDLWPATAERRAQTPSDLPVTAHLRHLSAPPATCPVFDAIRRAAPALAWRQTYGAADFGPAFLQGYGWSEFIGLRGPVPSTTLACGVMLLGPGIDYPPHKHAAEEMYLPLAGQALWQMGEGPYTAIPPGQPILHPSWVPHATRCDDQGLAAIYLWMGGDLAAKSVILPRR
jgi:mannose-6-phosphate isomerase-like protein (cupin superfamily)